MLIPDIIKEIMSAMREDYCFLVNHLAVILMMLVLIYIDDERSNRLLNTLLIALLLLIYPFHASYICTAWDPEAYRVMLNFLSLPIVAAYTIYCVSERHVGKKRIFAIAIGMVIFFVSCSLDSWTLEQFKFYRGIAI